MSASPVYATVRANGRFEVALENRVYSGTIDRDAVSAPNDGIKWDRGRKPKGVTLEAVAQAVTWLVGLTPRE